MIEPSSRVILELTYARLEKKLKNYELSAERLRSEALELLDKARVEIELDPLWVEQELDRLRSKPA